MNAPLQSAVATLVAITLAGCPAGYRDDLDYSYDVQQTWDVKEIESGPLVQFQTVKLDLISSRTIRSAIDQDNVAAGREVLVIGSGTGMIAVMCLIGDAKHVTATDRHRAAVANTCYNAAALTDTEDLDVRWQTDQPIDAFSALKPTEVFDLVIIDLDQIDDTRDAMTNLVDSLCAGIAQRLHRGGRGIVVTTSLRMIKHLEKVGKDRGLAIRSLDDSREDRDRKRLPEYFSPAMLMEVRRAPPDSKEIESK